jgi:hypothetical protein
MPEWSIEKFPGIPRIWIDYAAGLKHPLLPEPFDLKSLKPRTDQIRKGFSKKIDLVRHVEERALLCPDHSLESVRQLQSADSFAVVTKIYPSPFGGPASQFWKCLMAAKACEELARSGIKAVPVGLLSSHLRSDISRSSIELLDSRSELRSLSLPPVQGCDLVEKIRELGGDSYDDVFLRLMAGSCSAESGVAGAALRLFAALMEPWGMMFFDMPAVAATHAERIVSLQSRIRAEFVREQESNLARAGYAGESEGGLPELVLWSFLLPVFAQVTDSYELFPFSSALPVFDELGIARPLAWPYSGVTVGDARSRKILEKYNLEIFDLFSGERSVVECLLNSKATDSVLTKLDGLKSDVEQIFSRIGGQTGSLDDFEKEKDSCREKVLYQIQNLRQRFESARQVREEAVSRQIRRACNLLAPNRRIQESELSGIYFLLRNTQSVLQSVHDRLNASTFQHQLIFMD